MHRHEILEHPQNKTKTNAILQATSPAQPVTSHSLKIATDAIAEIHKETALGSGQEISGNEMDVVDPIYEPDLKEAYYFPKSKTFPDFRQIRRSWKNLYLCVNKDTKKMPFVFNLLQVVRSGLIQGCSLGKRFKKAWRLGVRLFTRELGNDQELGARPTVGSEFLSSDGNLRVKKVQPLTRQLSQSSLLGPRRLNLHVFL